MAIASNISIRDVFKQQQMVRFAVTCAVMGEKLLVRLLKNYANDEFKVAMQDSGVPSARLVDNTSGLTAIVYPSEYDEKMKEALNNLEKSMGSPQIFNGNIETDKESFSKMMQSRKDNSIIEFNNLSYADSLKFSFAACKQGISMMTTAINPNETSLSEQKYKVQFPSSELKDDKLDALVKNVAVLSIHNGSDSLDRSTSMLFDAIGEANEKVNAHEKFYVCSLIRDEAYIEVSDKGFSIMNASTDPPSVTKSVECNFQTPKSVQDLAFEISTFEDPVILSEDEFSYDYIERMSETSAKTKTLSMADETHEIINQRVVTLLNAANECNLDVESFNDVKNPEFLTQIQNSNMPNKDNIVIALAELQNYYKVSGSEVSDAFSNYNATVQRLYSEHYTEVQLDQIDERSNDKDAPAKDNNRE